MRAALQHGALPLIPLAPQAARMGLARGLAPDGTGRDFHSRRTWTRMEVASRNPVGLGKTMAWLQDSRQCHGGCSGR